MTYHLFVPIPRLDDIEPASIPSPPPSLGDVESLILALLGVPYVGDETETKIKWIKTNKKFT